jgi:hypothetical protein
LKCFTVIRRASSASAAAAAAAHQCILRQQHQHQHYVWWVKARGHMGCSAIVPSTVQPIQVSHPVTSCAVNTTPPCIRWLQKGCRRAAAVAGSAVAAAAGAHP